MEYVHAQNPRAVIRAFGQELNPESYAICKADMLIKGQDVSRIKLGNTLSNDQLYADKFDYMLSNPPFGVDWKKIEGDILKEHTEKGFDGRFGPGLPRVSDGSLLFLLHLLSKLRDPKDGGARIGIILNGSPLFTGGAGSGESEIRRHILESDLLEAVIALPTDMFYNTGIATYVWILSNKKAADRKGRVMLVNGVNLCGKMRKSLGSKRQEMSEADIKTITRAFGDFTAIEPTALDKPAETKNARGRPAATPKIEPEKTFAAKIFKTHEFGYRRITIERPLRLSWQFSDERLATLRFASGAVEAPMRWIFETFGSAWIDDPKDKTYGVLTAHETDIRTALKADFPELKEKHLKDLLATATWREQRDLLLKARQLQAKLGTKQRDDFNGFDDALATTGLKVDASEKKQITAAVSWKNPAATRVIKKLHQTGKPAPFYGLFEGGAASPKTLSGLVEFESDSDLRDFENVALDPTQPVDALNEAYFKKEVLPHVPDAWIDATKRDPKDDQVGLVGYEIPFNRHFYQYQPPRDLAEIDADLDAVSAEILKLLREVHS
jgi:type I restriction enzyme M protein